MRIATRASASDEASGFSLPAPVGGWNARDAVAAMPGTDALYLDNMFPQTSGVAARKGSALFATLPESTDALPHNIRSLLSYTSATVKKLFAGCDDGIYEVTAGGSSLTVATAATNGEWIGVNLSTAGGHFLWICNGIDKARYFDGSAWTVLDGTSTPAVTGLATTDISHVSLFKTRLMLTEKNSLSVWYFDVNSLAGDAVEYPMGALFKRGGYIVATATWTLDAGDGIDDKFVVVTSEGEVAVFSGTNPANAATWALSGVFSLARPVGKRPLVKAGGDLLLLTQAGVMPLSQALPLGRLDKAAAISDKIDKVFRDFLSGYSDLYGWEATIFPEGTMLLVNVPLPNRRSYQFVMNTTTKAWCRFTGWDAECFCYHGGELYFASSNLVYKAWTGGTDSNKAIRLRAKTAFQHKGGRGRVKRVTACRLIFSADATVKGLLGLDTDYTDANFASSTTSFIQLLSTWDASLWEAATWSTDSRISADWRTVSHKPGRAFALRFRAQLHGVTLEWMTTDFLYEQGGLL